MRSDPYSNGHLKRAWRRRIKFVTGFDHQLEEVCQEHPVNGRFERLIEFPMAWTVQSYIWEYICDEQPKSSRKASLEENWPIHIVTFLGFWWITYGFLQVFNDHSWEATFVMAAIITLHAA